MASSITLAKPSRWFCKKRTKAPSAASGDAQTQHYLDSFRRFDTNGDGRISVEELRSFLACSGEEISLEAAEGAVMDFDSNGDGLLDYGDFVRLVNGGGGGGDEDLRMAFEMFEGGGRITAGGLQSALRRMGEARSEQDCKAMIGAFDLNGDGVLDYNEFCRMMS